MTSGECADGGYRHRGAMAVELEEPEEARKELATTWAVPGRQRAAYPSMKAIGSAGRRAAQSIGASPNLPPRNSRACWSR